MFNNPADNRYAQPPLVRRFLPSPKNLEPQRSILTVHELMVLFVPPQRLRCLLSLFENFLLVQCSEDTKSEPPCQLSNEIELSMFHTSRRRPFSFPFTTMYKCVAYGRGSMTAPYFQRAGCEPVGSREEKHPCGFSLSWQPSASFRGLPHAGLREGPHLRQTRT